MDAVPADDSVLEVGGAKVKVIDTAAVVSKIGADSAVVQGQRAEVAVVDATTVARLRCSCVATDSAVGQSQRAFVQDSAATVVISQNAAVRNGKHRYGGNYTTVNGEDEAAGVAVYGQRRRAESADSQVSANGELALGEGNHPSKTGQINSVGAATGGAGVNCSIRVGRLDGFSQ